MSFRPKSVLRRTNPLGRKAKLSVKISDRDLGLNEILRSIGKLDKMVVSAGILLKDARKIYPKTKSLLGQVAIANEFGVGRLKNRLGYVPERSFMRDPFDRLNKKWYNRIRKFMAKQTPGQTLNKDVLEYSGKVMKNAIKLAITKKVKPTNAYRTIKKKGFDNPLIESRFMYRRIDFQSHKQQH